METLRELYWEALRAPDDLANFRRNPYKREQTIKRVFGKTSEERRMNIAAAKERIRKIKEDKDREIVENEILGEKEAKIAKEKRREVAQARYKLGFKDTEVLEDGSIINSKDGDGV